MTLPKLKHQQQEIIKQHYTYRFLNSTQIQKFLNHKSKGKINDWLPDLAKKNIYKEFMIHLHFQINIFGISINSRIFLGNGNP